MERLNKIAGHLQVSDAVQNQAAVVVERESTHAAKSNAQVFGAIGSKSPNDVVVVSALRTAIGKSGRGNFKNTTPDDLLMGVLEATIKKTGINPAIIDDIVCGNAQLSGAYSMPARGAMLRAGIPYTASVRSVNRQCSSGSQAVASIAADIATGMIDCGIGCGVESMSMGGNPGDPSSIPPMNMSATIEDERSKDILTPMGVTSETVAKRYGITREEQDELAVLSHAKALKAQKEGKFDAEIVPLTVTVEDKDGNEKTVTVSKDEGPREGTAMAGLAKLKPAFQAGGTTTAGNSSQTSDGAAAVLLMRRSMAEKLGLPILGIFRGTKVKGVKPDEMGIGPAVAIPALLKDVGLAVGDVDVFELNEAFASQAVYCVKKLGIQLDRLNPNGGAIALGHPLGCTGARQTATLLHELNRRKASVKKSQVGVVSMCIGTGMGLASVFEVQP